MITTNTASPRHADSSISEDAWLDTITDTHRKAGPRENCPETLMDCVGTTYTKRVDAIPLDPNDCTAEFKVGELNSRQDKLKAEVAEAKAVAKAMTAKDKAKAIQAYSWSNSAYAHSELTAKLPPLSHITVFKQWPTYENIKLYLKLGILFCHVSGFFELRRACNLTRKGFPIVRFSFCTPNGQHVSYPLWSIYQHQLTNFKARESQVPMAINVAFPLNKTPKKVWQAAGFESKKQKNARIKKEKLTATA